jgi:guanylate kinase
MPFPTLPAMHRLVILSGPSCIGKGPLLQALRRIHPDIAFGQTIRYTSRVLRPGEKDGVEFHFRSAVDIRALPSGRFMVYPMRNQWQALDMDEVEQLLLTQDRVITELYPPVLSPLLEHPRVRVLAARLEIRTVFLTPLTEEELAALSAHAPERPLEEIIADVMRIKQIARALKQGKLLTATELEDIAIRAGQAYAEMQYAGNYGNVIVNHDGEDSDHWRFTPPVGDAGRTLRELVRIIKT